MVRKRFLELAPARQEKIFDAAAEEFSSRGYEAASVNRIIDHAGISKGSLYYYFDDKEDLFATVIERAFNRLKDGAGFVSPDELTADTFWNNFRDLMRRSVDFFQRNEWYVRLARSYHQLRATAPTSPATQRVLELGRDYIRTILERGQELGVVRRDLPLELLVEVTMAVDEASSRWRMQHWTCFPQEQRVGHADAQIDLIRDMLHADNEGWED